MWTHCPDGCRGRASADLVVPSRPLPAKPPSPASPAPPRSRLLRPNHPPPPRPRRRPPTQPRAAHDHSHTPRTPRATIDYIDRRTREGKSTREATAASSATSPATSTDSSRRPQALTVIEASQDLSPTSQNPCSLASRAKAPDFIEQLHSDEVPRAVPPLFQRVRCSCRNVQVTGLISTRSDVSCAFRPQVRDDGRGTRVRRARGGASRRPRRCRASRGCSRRVSRRCVP